MHEAAAVNVKTEDIWYTIYNKSNCYGDTACHIFTTSETELWSCCPYLFLFWLRLDAPSLRGSFTSSSWPPSPGCVLRGSSCTSCWWRSSRVSTHGKSTTTCPVTSSRPSWSVSPRLLTTGATGQTKRKCLSPNESLEITHCVGFTCCVCMRQLLKRNLLIISASTLTCVPGDYAKTFELLLPGMGSCSIFYVIWKWLTDSTLWFQGGRSYINAFLLKDPPVTSCL